MTVLARAIIVPSKTNGVSIMPSTKYIEYGMRKKVSRYALPNGRRTVFTSIIPSQSHVITNVAYFAEVRYENFLHRWSDIIMQETIPSK